MLEPRHAPLAVTALIGALLLGACAESVVRPSTVVPIRSFSQVAGKWDGLAIGAKTAGDASFFLITIADDGTYQAGTTRGMGVFAGSGKLTIKDGKLITEADSDSATYTLYESGGKRVLQLDGVVKPGRGVTANLTPAKK